MSSMTHQIDRLGAGRRVDDSQAFAAGRAARARAVISLALTVHPANVLPVHRKLRGVLGSRDVDAGDVCGENSESRRGARQGPLAAARVRSTLLPIDERFGGLVGEPVFGVLP